MMRPFSSFLFAAGCMALAVLSGCRKEEQAYPSELVDTLNLNDLYGNRTATVHLGGDYRQQAYYSLVNNELVGTFDKYSWEFGLTHDTAPLFFLNSSIPGLRVARTSSAWSDPIDPAGLAWEYDLSSRQPEDLAIGSDWEQVLVLDRGLDPDGLPRGLKKVRLTSAPEGFTLLVANLDGTDATTYTATANADFHATQWSLDAGAVVASPPKDSWDLLFTSYLVRFEDEAEPFPYQVTGALLNPCGRRAARLDGVPFASVATTPDVVSLLSDDADAVGYDWKTYDFELGYAVTPDLSFAVECGTHGIRALTFTGFVNSLGEPGSPAFTHRLLP